MKNKVKVFFSFLTCVLVAVLNQNCGEQSAAYFSNEDLASNHSPSILDFEQPDSNARVGDRVFIASVLAEIFLPQGKVLSEAASLKVAGKESVNIKEYISDKFHTRDKATVDLISNLILKNVDDFKGPCSVVEKDATCASPDNVNERILHSSASTVAPGSVNKEGFRISACNEILSRNRSAAIMVYNLKGKASVKMTEEDIIDVYDLFYPAQAIDEEAYEALVEVYDAAQDESVLDVWRAVALPICHSAGWQIP